MEQKRIWQLVCPMQLLGPCCFQAMNGLALLAECFRLQKIDENRNEKENANCTVKSENVFAELLPSPDLFGVALAAGEESQNAEPGRLPTATRATMLGSDPPDRH